MTQTEARIYEVLGQRGKEFKALSCAVTVMEKLLLEEKRSIYDIRVTKQVYPEVAKQMGDRQANITRNIERAARRCWDLKENKIKELVIGDPFEDLHSPKDIILYLAVYAHFGIPYYEALRKFPDCFG